jgi:hypothetical protein
MPRSTSSKPISSAIRAHRASITAVPAFAMVSQLFPGNQKERKTSPSSAELFCGYTPRADGLQALSTLYVKPFFQGIPPFHHMENPCDGKYSTLSVA